MKTHRVKIRHLAAAAVIAAQIHPLHAPALTSTNQEVDVQTLLQRVKELEEKVKILERNHEVDQEVTEEKAKGAPTVSLSANGLSVRSADSNFVMNVYGYVQADGRFYLGQKTVNDEFLLRRVRPILEGTVFSNFDYRLMLDFGSGNVASSTAANNAILDDAYVNARLRPQLQVQVGKYKVPIGLERLQSTADLLFVETGFATELTPNYDLGATIHNKLFNNQVDYSVGIFNGATDGGSDDAETADEGKDVVGRVFAQPFLNTDFEPARKLGFGVAGSYGYHFGAASLSSYKTPGQQTFFAFAPNASANGEQYRIDPQLFYYWGPFGLEAEYVLSSEKVKTPTLQDRLNNTAWQVEASYFLTGEENGFKYTSAIRVDPRHPFTLGGGGWGAFEVVARLEQLSLDKLAPLFATATSARVATSWGAGLNWYLNRNIKLQLDYEQTHFTGGSTAAGSATAHPEHVVLSRVQFSF
jgi:phosphate-selective porin OprO and OprP